MKPNQEVILDSFDFPEEVDTSWKICESEGESVVDGVNILGRAVGPFFIVDGETRNKRFYSKALWEKVINESITKLANGQMLGTIGHKQSLDDEALLEGKVSHRVTKLSIDEGGKYGIGEILILSTPAGKILNSYLRGGVQLPISSRAFGEYKGQRPSGAKILDESTFKLEGFDFVRLPGVPGAIPMLVESDLSTDSSTDSLNNNIDLNSKIQSSPEIFKMSPEVIETLTRDKVKLEGQLSDIAESLKSKEVELASLKLIVESQTKTLSLVESELLTAKSTVTSQVAQISELSTLNESYKTLGSANEINESISTATKLVESYKDIGSPEELTQALSQAMELVEDYRELGSPDEIEQALELTESYVALGTPTEITTLVSSLEEYLELGTVSELNSTLSTLESYSALGSVDLIQAANTKIALYEAFGTPEEIEEAFKLMESLATKQKAEGIKREATEIATKYNVKSNVVESMIVSLGNEGTVEALKSIQETADVSNRYKSTSMNSDEDTSSLAGKTRLERMAENFGK